jgi:hypothetical protein
MPGVLVVVLVVMSPHPPKQISGSTLSVQLLSHEVSGMVLLLV